MKVGISGNALFGVYGTIDVPSGVSVEDFLQTQEGKDAAWEAFTEYWDNTGIKLRDAAVCVIATSDPETDSDEREFDEVIEVN